MSRNQKDDWELTAIVEPAKSEIQARERCRPAPQSKLSPLANEFMCEDRKPRNERSTASTLFNSGVIKEPSLSCLFCQRNHRASDCTSVTNIGEKKAHFRRQGRCFICFRRGEHIARNCNANIQCTECKGRHHKAVCEKLLAPTKEENESESESNSGNETKTNAGCAAFHVNTGTQVFLQTAQVFVANPNRENCQGIQVRALFDTGSQRSYLSQQIVNKLKLETVQTDNLIITTFGEDNKKAKAVNLVELSVRKPETGFVTNLNVFAVPKICSDLQGQDINWAKERYPHLSEVDYADSGPMNDSMQVDLLIGSDYMWEFLDGRDTVGAQRTRCYINQSRVGYIRSSGSSCQGKTFQH